MAAKMLNEGLSPGGGLRHPDIKGSGLSALIDAPARD